MNPQKHAWMVFALGVLIVAVDGFMRAYLLVHGLPGGLTESMADDAVKTFDAGALLVIGYFFGSSAGSQRKTELGVGAAPPVTPEKKL